jgi:plasmid segregation protein ParM
MAIKAGADAGNYALKLWVKGKKPIMIPSVYSEYMGMPVDALEMPDIPVDKLEDNIDITISSSALELNNVRYIVGKKVATDMLEPIEMEKKSDKSKDEIPVIVTLAGLAISAMKDHPDKNEIEVSYDLGVALPIAFINPENAKRNEKRFMGTHIVTFHHPSGRDVKVTIKIEFCKCLPEGAAAIWGVVFDEEGNPLERLIEDEKGVRRNVSFLDTVNLSFDIGAGTTEVVVTHGLNYKPNLSKGLDYGTKATILEIITLWNKQNPRKPIESVAEFNEIYFDTEHPRHVELRTLSAPFFRQLAVKISKEIINKIDDMKDDPFVFIYGGGQEVLKPELETILRKRGRDKNVIFLKDPMFVNAKGLLVYVCSPRFEELKKQALGAVQNG